MPKGFRPNPAGFTELLGVTGPFGRELRRFSKEVEESAKRKALVGYPRKDRPGSSPGQLAKSVKAGPVHFGPTGLEVEVSAYRREGQADVAMIIHQGHKEIYPKDKPLRFFARQKRPGYRGNGKYVVIHPVDQTADDFEGRVGHVRAVGGHPFLMRALEEAAVGRRRAPGVGIRGTVEWRTVVLRPWSKKRPPARSGFYINL